MPPPLTVKPVQLGMLPSRLPTSTAEFRRDCPTTRKVLDFVQYGGADLAVGGAEGAVQAAEERSAVAERRILHPAETGEEKPCVGL